MLNRLVSTLLLVFIFSAQAEPWTTEQKVLSATYLTAHVIDWGQTRSMVINGGYGDNNPILGKHPSMAKVNTYFLVVPIIGYYALDAFPKNRTGILGFLNAVEILQVAHNYRIGVRVSF